MRWQVAIPSYKRLDTLKAKTLSTLDRLGVHSASIHVFVANQAEYNTYAPALRPLGYHVIKGVSHLHRQRAFMTSYFPEGQPLLYMDDDISEILLLHPATQGLKPMTSPAFHVLLDTVFSEMRATHTYLFGIAPVANAYFMSSAITWDLKFAVGAMYGVINRHDPRLRPTLEEKEDVERTLLNYALDKRVLRLNYLTIKTQYYREAGGMQAWGNDRKEKALQSALYLSRHYPQLCTLYTKKKSGFAEVKLRDKSQPYRKKNSYTGPLALENIVKKEI